MDPVTENGMVPKSFLLPFLLATVGSDHLPPSPSVPCFLFCDTAPTFMLSYTTSISPLNASTTSLIQSVHHPSPPRVSTLPLILLSPNRTLLVVPLTCSFLIPGHPQWKSTIFNSATPSSASCLPREGRRRLQTVHQVQQGPGERPFRSCCPFPATNQPWHSSTPTATLPALSSTRLMCTVRYVGLVGPQVFRPNALSPPGPSSLFGLFAVGCGVKRWV